jgi:16S rRNA (guanine527-N7)-methyltransferase
MSADALFLELLDQRGTTLTLEQEQQFEDYYELLVSWNEKMNLTAITDKHQVYLKHFYDSLTLGFFLPLQHVETVADIGSGAGFPSLPIKIMYPHLKITIVDSLNKRIQFLQHLCSRLKLDNVRCIHARAEEAGRSPEHRDHYDLVTARAVARLNVLNELCLPFVKKGGWFVAMKGAQAKDEIIEAAYSAKELQAELAEQPSFELPEEISKRHLVIYRKLGVTPRKYPRKPGTPAKMPLLETKP